jgi:hypothetical protein
MGHEMKIRFLALLLSLAATSASAATLVVVEARGIALKPGTVLDAATPLALKQGQHVTLISESGSTLKLDGPYDRPPTAQGGTSVDLSRTLGVLVTQRHARSGEVGTTRGTVLATLPDPWLIDVTHSGNECLTESRTPIFWRPDSSSAATLAIEPIDRSWKAQTVWAAGLDRITITTDVPLHAGETYVITFNGVENAITIDAVPAVLSNDAMRAAWMADKGCEAQAQAVPVSAK